MHLCTNENLLQAICKYFELAFFYTGAAVFTDGRFGSNNMYSLFQRISCNNSMLVSALDQCTLYEVTDCLPSCLPIGIRCYGEIIYSMLKYNSVNQLNSEL